jgi:hypothetical protein
MRMATAELIAETPLHASVASEVAALVARSRAAQARDLINETWVSRPLAHNKVIRCDKALFGKDVIELVG